MSNYSPTNTILHSSIKVDRREDATLSKVSLNLFAKRASDVSHASKKQLRERQLFPASHRASQPIATIDEERATPARMLRIKNKSIKAISASKHLPQPTPSTFFTSSSYEL